MFHNQSARREAERLIRLIRQYWGEKVSNLRIVSLIESPYNMFTLQMQLYKVYTVNMEYDRSTLSIKILIDGNFLTLSRVAEEPIFKGFESYRPEKLMHNFEVLDKTLCTMLQN